VAVTTAPPKRRGRPPRTDDQRAEHRTRLVTTAMDAVRRFGPEVSLDQIADAAEVSKPVFYAEFGDKNGLVDAMAVVLAAGIEEQVRADVAAAGRFDANLVIRSIIHGLIDLIDAEPHLYGYIVRSLRMRDRGLLDNALARVVHERASFIISALGEEMLRQDLEVLTAGVFGFVFGVVESWVETRRPPKEDLVATITAAIEAGLAAVAAQRRAVSRPGSGPSRTPGAAGA
jgi:AcrR family transcriptional regulator